MNNPTPEQLADPQWWNDNAPDGATQFALEDENYLPCWVKDKQGWLYPLDNSWDFDACLETDTRTLVDRPSRTDKQQVGNKAEYTGGSVSYYTLDINNPTNEHASPYTVECNDIIEALNMNYAEGNAFKAIWRKCAARLGSTKKGYTDGLYDAEKVVFFGERMVAQYNKEQNNEQNTED